MLYPHCPYERNAVDDERHRDADNYETICRTVNGLDGKSMIHEHDGQKVPPTKVYVDQKPRSGDGGLQPPTEDAYALDRADVKEEVETSGSQEKRKGDEEGRSSEPELRPGPVDALGAGSWTIPSR